VLETATRHDDYAPPDRARVITIGSEELGVTNSLLLKFPQIHCAGDLALLNKPRIAIAGARRASIAGRRRASQLARDCARMGVVVISGLAEGVDYAAHTSTIEHGGRTIAVIGTAMDTAYPAKHAALQREIYRKHLLLSPFAWGAKSVSDNFPERNRVMARLAMATVIIEARDTSGSLHQARESIEGGVPCTSPKLPSAMQPCRGPDASSARTNRWVGSFEQAPT
jgi:DNA processing protein